MDIKKQELASIVIAGIKLNLVQIYIIFKSSLIFTVWMQQEIIFAEVEKYIIVWSDFPRKSLHVSVICKADGSN